MQKEERKVSLYNGRKIMIYSSLWKQALKIQLVQKELKKLLKNYTIKNYKNKRQLKN